MNNDKLVSCIICPDYCGQLESCEMKCMMYDHVMKVAEQKDQEFKKEKEALINKACEWILDNIYDDYSPEEFRQQLEEILKEFKKVMEGGKK